MRLTFLFTIGFVIFSLTTPNIALCYIGPGAGLTVIGTVVAFIGAIILAFIGFFWYPLKKLIKKFKQSKKDHSENPES